MINTKTNPIIRLKDVWKIYSLGKVKVEALRGFSLSIYKNEFVVIMGPSGSGKSTTVNMIGCLDTPSKGEIDLYSKNISDLTESELAQIRGKKIGFIFQKFNLLNSLTALENVMLPMTFHNIDASDRKKKATELLEKVGLGDRINHKPNELSGGQQQRVAIARALAVDPEILLADEPTGNLDSKSGQQIMEMLDDLYYEGKTIILVTHDSRYLNHGTRKVTLIDGMVQKEEDNKESHLLEKRKKHLLEKRKTQIKKNNTN
jgi:putative ABC transport system ATP-binding protein